MYETKNYESKSSLKVATPPTKRINSDHPDITSSYKRKIFFPEGLVDSK